MAPSFSLVQEITAREARIFRDDGKGHKSHFGTSGPLGPRVSSSWAQGENVVLSALPVPDSRGIGELIVDLSTI